MLENSGQNLLGTVGTISSKWSLSIDGKEDMSEGAEENAIFKKENNSRSRSPKRLYKHSRYGICVDELG